jgi:hypothetical protein
MVLTVNPPPGSQPGSHTLFKAAAIRTGNLGLRVAALAAAAPAPQVMSTISIGLAGAAAQPTTPATGAAGSGTVVQGTGKTSNGQPCGCSCLCGAGQPPPAGVAVGNFGGVAGMFNAIAQWWMSSHVLIYFVGELPAPSAALGAMSPANIGPMRMVRFFLDKQYRPPLY